MSIPYFEIPTPKLGPLPIQPFGVLVAAGCLIGAEIVRRRAERYKLDPDATQTVIGWILVCGFLGAHLVDVFAYQPGALWEDPILLLKIWEGISSFGGFFGAFAGFLFITWRRKLPRLPYADALALGLSVGWVFGRMGCTIVHDHPGKLTDFFLAVDYPGGARHDLGFYELLYAIGLAAVLFLVARRPRPPGLLIGILATGYAPVRFFLDYLRRTDGVHPDPRYFGLTPAQYLAVGTLIIGVALIRIAYARGAPPAELAEAPTVEPEAAAAPARSGGGGGGSKRKRKRR